MSVEEQARAAVASVIDRLIEATRTIDGLKVERAEDAVATTAARLALRRIADPDLRDLAYTAARR